MKYRFNSLSESDTIRLGREIGKNLRGGEILALCGELGSGKTYFTNGIAMGLGIDRDEVVSPTFTIVNEYIGRLKMYHSDFYRIDNCLEMETTGLADYFGDEDSVIVIEWAGKVESLLPEERLKIFISSTGENSREFEFVDSCSCYGYIIEVLKEWEGY